MSKKEIKCSSCGSTSLSKGKSGVYRHTFIPEGKIMMMGYDIKAFACLSCGHLDFYLGQYELKELKSKLDKS